MDQEVEGSSADLRSQGEKIPDYSRYRKLDHLVVKMKPRAADSISNRKNVAIVMKEVGGIILSFNRRESIIALGIGSLHRRNVV